MLKIGEFSSLAQISIRALRHYDELGLLEPARVDPETGYRLYSVSQLPRLHRILALRDLGFPLERIAQALDGGVSVDALKGMLMLREAEQETQVRDEMQRLERLQALLHLMEKEGRMSGDVILKEVGPQWIVSLREKIATYSVVGGLFGKLYGSLGSAAAEGHGMALFHDTDYREQNVDVEAGVCTKQQMRVAEPLTCRQLPATTVASVVHHGAFNRVAEAYGDLLRWIEANGYGPCGPTREIFLHVETPVSRDDERNVTEIQVPVAKG